MTPGGGSPGLPAEVQQEIVAKEALVARGDPFALLGVAVEASPEEIREAFYAASKRIHPDRYFRMELGPWRARLERVFQALNEAHDLLGDRVRRAQYLREHPELTARVDLLDGKRRAERRGRLARHPYLMKAGRSRELLAKARELVESDQPARAIELLLQVKEHEPRSEEANSLLSRARQLLERHQRKAHLQEAERAHAEGDLPRAVTYAQRAVASAPADPKAQQKLAELLIATGAGAEAKAHAQRAAELLPRSADAQVLLANALIASGDRKLARKSLERALELDPKHREAQRLLKQTRRFF